MATLTLRCTALARNAAHRVRVVCKARAALLSRFGIIMRMMSMA